MKPMVVCFLYKNTPREVLLGFKKAGFGTGKYTGIGGKIEAGEIVKAAAVREVQEEIGVEIHEDDLEFMGKVTFLFPAKADWSQVVAIFLVSRWQGKPEESGEIKPFWFSIDKMPYERMWQDARHWLPVVLSGQKIQATIIFKSNNETVDEVRFDPLL